VSTVSLVIGAWFAGKNFADAMASAGAVVVVCGVMLASSGKIDELHTKTINFINSRRVSERASIKELMTSSNGTEPSDKEVDEIDWTIGIARTLVVIQTEVYVSVCVAEA
jgi:hypothetical protein